VCRGRVEIREAEPLNFPAPPRRWKGEVSPRPTGVHNAAVSCWPQGGWQRADRFGSVASCPVGLGDGIGSAGTEQRGEGEGEGEGSKREYDVNPHCTTLQSAAFLDCPSASGPSRGSLVQGKKETRPSPRGNGTELSLPPTCPLCPHCTSGRRGTGGHRSRRQRRTENQTQQRRAEQQAPQEERSLKQRKRAETILRQQPVRVRIVRFITDKLFTSQRLVAFPQADHEIELFG
jgi:hypothetical protein